MSPTIMRVPRTHGFPKGTAGSAVQTGVASQACVSNCSSRPGGGISAGCGQRLAVDESARAEDIRPRSASQRVLRAIGRNRASRVSDFKFDINERAGFASPPSGHPQNACRTPQSSAWAVGDVMNTRVENSGAGGEFSAGGARAREGGLGLSIVQRIVDCTTEGLGSRHRRRASDYRSRSRSRPSRNDRG
jgi:hypothetical protein